ncbi:DMT family transporter [Paenibacillus sp. N1-5-1-14]|uniref:DMT family transporter n=1 Tax=Paenibacillus radicibacter TaxID=2972488 RepID=UPI0021595C37|nr:DMT family transporter [Paenibacillus radicibacter]MCR8642474.1 DMT family transporter [Paenibacillus radicibacter]
MNAKQFFTHPLGILASAVTATFLWGSSFPFIKKSYVELQISSSDIFEQFVFAGYRFIAAALIIMVIMKVLGKSIMPQKGTLGGVTKLGLIQTFLQYLFLYVGISISSGIQGSIITGTTSFFQIIVAHFMFKNDSLTTRKVIGIILGFSAVLAVNLGKGDFLAEFGWGAVLLLVSMFCGGLGNVLSKGVAQKMELMYMTSYQMLLGGIGLLVVGGLQAGFAPFTFTPKAIGMLAYLSFLSAVGFVLWNSVMKYNKVGKVSMYLFLMPVFGVILSALLLQEQVRYTAFIALALVVTGIVIVNRDGKQKQASRSAVQNSVQS